ncbi:SusD/RagB family nutrient-binding outer membrane lipoprotein [Flavobacterium sp.]|uniref:SusD/RagB family nutrient-binding outer membrane lipoprotein n=1 Tax=Flavobacterium sp. TaxID=239 RepID=UPI00286A5440|nr:SusD/RagB family nutrient-binding outer membrane lipoprotein [Flavobacterium sp.]
MKKNNIYIILISMIGLIVNVSCESLELDKSKDPFSLSPEQADVEFLFNSIEKNFARQIEGNADFSNDENWESGGSTNGDGLSLFGAELTRMYAMSNTNSRNYATVYQASDSDDEWTNSYAGIISNIRTMTPLALAVGKTRHVAIAQFIEAYTMTAMVDFYGDIPYTEIGQGLANTNPKTDSGASIYAAAIVLLDNAIVNFTNTVSAKPNSEVFYNNDYSKWIKAVNTLKMKLYLQTRLVDNTAASKFNDIVASGDYITNSSDDLVYRWLGSSASNPDNRHPRYGLNYTPTGASDYMSNWLMGTMDNASDPRLRYYFYRQVAAVPGQEIDVDEQNLKCSLQSAPVHYVTGGFTFCSLPHGYWGRDHGDNDGVPPDGFLKSTFGVYPAGGKFDGDNFLKVYNTATNQPRGARGNGITPILLASWGNFMKAEMALANNDPGLAKTEMMEGIDKSINKVMSFGPRDPDFDVDFAPAPADVSNFTDAVSSEWDAADVNGRWNVLGVQQFRAVFGNGIESYNFYRRTGYPTTLQPDRSPTPGNFVRSLYYPSNAVNNNANMTQKANQSVPVFWDNNASGPIAN